MGCLRPPEPVPHPAPGRQPVSQALAEALAARLRHAMPANVALMQLLMEAPSRAAAEEALALVPVLDPALATAAQSVARLLLAHPEAWRVVHGVSDSVDHAPSGETADAALDHWRRAFDRLAETSPEAGVALYALGDPGLLDAATAEVIDALQAWGLVAPSHDVFDLGCGIGRFATALAPKVRSVLGSDLSDRMVAEARRRNQQPNVRFLQGSGHDLAGVATRGFDLVLAADVFPYLVEASLADRHIGEIARILRPGGTAVILNYSYRGDPERDGRELAAAATASGLAATAPVLSGLRLWDAAVYRLVKPVRQWSDPNG